MRRNRFALHVALVVMLLHMPSAYAAAPVGASVAPQSQPAGQATATSAVTKTARLAGDADGDGRADPGDTIRYTVAISNATGLDATGVTLSDPLDPNTSLVAGSVQVSALAFPDSYTALRNTTLTTPAPGVLNNDTGTPAPSAVVSTIATAQGGTAVLAADGSFAYAPPNGFTGSDSFRYTSQNSTGSDTATVTIAVQAAPVAVDDDYGAVINTPRSVAAPGVLANDSGFPAPAAQPFTGSSSQGGSVVLAADGSFTYTPPNGYTGADSFSYTAESSLGTATATVSLLVGNAPIASNDSYSTARNTTLTIFTATGLLQNDSLATPAATLTTFGGGLLGGAVSDHPAGTTVAVGTGGSLQVNADGSFIFMPATGFAGRMTFQYRLANGIGSADALVTIDVTQAPTITSASSSAFAVGQSASFTITTSGFPLPALTSSGTLPAGLTFVDNGDGTATLSGTPAAGTGGTYTLLFMAANGMAPGAIQKFTLAISETPAITSANSATFPLGQASSFTVAASGYPAPAITLTNALPGGVTFVDNGNGTATLSGTPQAGSAGTYTLLLRATNASGSSPDQSFTLTVTEPPSITSATSAAFTVGKAGSFTVTTGGFPLPQITQANALPAGVTFADNGDGTATLSGTPQAGSGNIYTLALTTANGIAPDASQTFTLTVDEAPQITSSNTATFSAGQAGSFSVTASGFPKPALAVTGNLPTGVTFSDNGNGTASLQGTPASGSDGSYSLTVTATNAASTDTQNFVLTVSAIPTITSATNATFVVGRAGSFTVTTTGFPLPSISQQGALPAGVTFADNGNGSATLSGTPAAGSEAVYTLTFKASNSAGSSADQTFTLTVGTPPAVTSAASATFTVSQNQTFTIQTSGFPAPAISTASVLPGGVTFVDNGDGTATLSGTPQAGSGNTYTLALTAANGIAPDASQAFTLTVNEAPQITTANNVTFTVGQAGSFTITATGYPSPLITRSNETLPNGITFGTSGNGTATLSGTPAAGSGGTYTFTLTASNGVASDATQSFTLTINEAPAIISAARATFTVGQLGSYTVQTHGFPRPSLAQSGMLPGGVTFTDNGDGTATIAGTPQAATGGNYALSLTATNTLGSDAQQFTLTVQQAPKITSAASTTFVVGQAGSFTVTTTGFPPPGLTASGALPGEITFTDNTNGTATLAGTVTSAADVGQYVLLITAANGVLPNDTQNLTLNVVCPTITLLPAAGSLADGTYQKLYSQVFTAAGGGASYAYTRSAGTLPPGMSLASNGTLSGTPTDTGIFNFTVKAANPAGCFGTAAYTLTVRPDAQANSYTGGVGNTQYVVGATAPATPHVFTSGSILGNDKGPGTLSTSLKTAPTNGAVVINANGTFVYTPNAGFAGPSDSFEYTLTDGNGITASTTVTVNLSNVVWYVNASGANGDGRSNSPFNSLANAQAPSASGDTIFVHSAAGNTPGGIVLKNDQTLWGQGTAFTLNGLTIAAGARPTVTGKVVLATGATVSSLIVNVVGDSALTGSSVSGITTKNNVELVSTDAPAVDLNGVGGAISLRRVSSSGATNGIKLTNTTGSFTITGDGGAVANGSGGTITASGAGILISTAQSVSLTALNISNTLSHGIQASGVNGFVLTYSNIVNSGDQANEDGVNLSQVSGTVTFDHDSVTASKGSNAVISNTSGTISALTVTNSTFNSTSATTGLNGFSILFRSGNPALTTATVQNSSFSSNRGAGFNLDAEGTSIVGALTFSSNTLTNNRNGLILSSAGNGSITNVHVTGNTLSGSETQISVANNSTAAAVIRATFTGNTIASTLPVSEAFWVVSEGNGSIYTAIQNNQVTAYGETGITVESRSGLANVQASVTNNTVSGGGAGDYSAFFFHNGNGAPGENPQLCVNIDQNKATSGSIEYLVQHDSAGSNRTKIQNLTPSVGATSAQVEAFIAAHNTATNGKIMASGTAFDAGTCVAPLTAAGGNGPGADQVLTQPQLDGAIAIALARLQAAGLPASQLQSLRQVAFTIADLDAAHLGESGATTIRIDRDAAGWGWYTDPTGGDAAFASESAGSELVARAGSPAAGRIDLLTVVLHELGHMAGRADLDGMAQAHDVMASALPTGVRREPAALTQQAAATTVSVPIGVLPPGKHVIVTFDVSVATRLPIGVTHISNQATVTGSTIGTLVSDDPATPALNDPTVVAVGRFQQFLPLVVNALPITGDVFPDLVVEQLSTTGGSVQIVLRNQGAAPVVNGFWVDVYVNPDRAPTRVNETWNIVGTQGLAWGVTEAIPAGGNLALTVGDRFYHADASSVSGPINSGTTLYVQVDSADTATTYGAVLESHEVAGAPYNNILGPVKAQTTIRIAGQATGSQSPDFLPGRPKR